MFTLTTKCVIKVAFVRSLFQLKLRNKFAIICFIEQFSIYCLNNLWTLIKLQILLMLLLTQISTKTLNLFPLEWDLMLKLFTGKSFNYSLDKLSQRPIKRYNCCYCFGLLRLYYLFLLVSLPRFCFSLAGKQTIYITFDDHIMFDPKYIFHLKVCFA